MAGILQGKRIAFLTANEGVEQVELTEPWKAVSSAGGTPLLIAPKPGQVQAFNHLDKAATFPVDEQVADADLRAFDALVLPGGVANPDQLRMVPAAVHFVRTFEETGRPLMGDWLAMELGGEYSHERLRHMVEEATVEEPDLEVEPALPEAPQPEPEHAKLPSRRHKRRKSRIWPNRPLRRGSLTRCRQETQVQLGATT